MLTAKPALKPARIMHLKFVNNIFDKNRTGKYAKKWLFAN